MTYGVASGKHILQVTTRQTDLMTDDSKFNLTYYEYSVRNIFKIQIYFKIQRMSDNVSHQIVQGSRILLRANLFRLKPYTITNITRGPRFTTTLTHSVCGNLAAGTSSH